MAPIHLVIKSTALAPFNVNVDNSDKADALAVLLHSRKPEFGRDLRLLFKGKILKGEQTLSQAGIHDGDTIVVARSSRSVSMAAAVAPFIVTVPTEHNTTSAPSALAATREVPDPLTSALTPSPVAVVQEDATSTTRSPSQLKLTVMSAATPVFTAEVTDDQTVATLSAVVFSLKPELGEELFFAHKGTVLRDDQTLREVGLQTGDTIAVARRTLQTVHAVQHHPTRIPRSKARGNKALVMGSAFCLLFILGGALIRAQQHRPQPTWVAPGPSWGREWVSWENLVGPEMRAPLHSACSGARLRRRRVKIQAASTDIVQDD